jgi:UPF0755 protein
VLRKFLLVLAILVIVVGFWYRWQELPVDAADDTPQSVTIEQGMSLNGIAAMLEEKELIRSARAFTIFARVHGAQSKLQAGDFYLKKSMNSSQILEALKKGLSQEIALTIPEGFTVKDIDALLVKEGLITAGQFSECARTCVLEGFSFLPSGAALAKRGGRVEGYLFPDTYFVAKTGFTPEAFIKRMLETFRTRVIDGLPEIATSGKSLHEAVTMASLIEEETRHDDERAIVSGILWKRLQNSVTLGVDAAVRYIVEKPSSAITLTDLDIDSPYNLRKFLGLPPGPIASPGLESIRAALAPQSSKYWYYLHDANGVIHYAETNDEHNANKQRYL